MSEPSTRRAVISSIMLIACMAFLIGIFAMGATSSAAHGNWWQFAVQLGVLPIFVLAIVLHARLILRRLPA